MHRPLFYRKGDDLRRIAIRIIVADSLDQCVATQKKLMPCKHGVIAEWISEMLNSIRRVF